jgi:hypothetical protein
VTNPLCKFCGRAFVPNEFRKDVCDGMLCLEKMVDEYETEQNRLNDEAWAAYEASKGLQEQQMGPTA